MITAKILAEQCGITKATVMNFIRRQDLLDACELKGNTYYLPNSVADAVRACYAIPKEEEQTTIEEPTEQPTPVILETGSDSKYIDLLERQLAYSEKLIDELNRKNDNLLSQLSEQQQTIKAQSEEIHKLTESNSAQAIQLLRYQLQEPKQEEQETDEVIEITTPVEVVEPVRQEPTEQQPQEKLGILQRFLRAIGI